MGKEPQPMNLLEYVPTNPMQNLCHSEEYLIHAYPVHSACGP